MAGRNMYLSASERTKSLIISQYMHLQFTDHMDEADYVLLEKQLDGTLNDTQFRDLMIAKERGLKIGFIKIEKERQNQMLNTRKFLDTDVGLE